MRTQSMDDVDTVLRVCASSLSLLSSSSLNAVISQTTEESPLETSSSVRAPSLTSSSRRTRLPRSLDPTARTDRPRRRPRSTEALRTARSRIASFVGEEERGTKGSPVFFDRIFDQLVKCDIWLVIRRRCGERRECCIPCLQVRDDSSLSKPSSRHEALKRGK